MGPGQAGTLGGRPTGVAILAILEVVGGVLGLWGAKLLLDYADWHKAWYGTADNYQILGLASAAGAIAAFVLAWGLWSIRPWAWLLGCALSIIGAVFAVLSLASGGGDSAASALINIVVDGAVLYYLNLNSIWALFGRPPTTLLQPQTAQGPQGPQPPQYPR
jgi:hypothetical protein